MTSVSKRGKKRTSSASRPARSKKSRALSVAEESRTEDGAVEDESNLAEVEVLEPSDEDLATTDREGAEIFADPAIVDDVIDVSESPNEDRAIVRSQRSLALQDPLQAYINETRRYPLLSREEEHELAKHYQETGDLDAARRLITANLRLVVKIAHEYRKAYRNLLDLIQEGNIGLMQAVRKFDPHRGVKLSTYASWWIRAYILKFILSNWRLVKIGTTQAQRKLFYNLRKEMEQLRALGFDQPTPKLLAERLHVPEQEVTSMQQRLAGSDISLDAPLPGDDERHTRLDYVRANTTSPEQSVGDSQFHELLREKINAFGKTLKGRDKEIFELRTVSDEPLTLQEVGDKYGITRERARQIEERLIGKLREHLRDELGDAVNVALETPNE